MTWLTRTALVAWAFAVASVALAHDSAGNPHRAGIESATTDAVATRIGTVSGVVVEDRPRGVTRRHAELELADGTLVPLQGPGADALPAGARVELRGHRDGKSLTVDSARTLAPLAPTDKAVTEVDPCKELDLRSLCVTRACPRCRRTSSLCSAIAWPR